MRLRIANTRILYRERPEDQSELCASITWGRIRAGQPFQKLLHVRAESPAAIINIMVTSSTGSTGSPISNYPLLLEDLATTLRETPRIEGIRITERKSTLRILEKMEAELRHL